MRDFHVLRKSLCGSPALGANGRNVAKGTWPITSAELGTIPIELENLLTCLLRAGERAIDTGDGVRRIG